MYFVVDQRFRSAPFADWIGAPNRIIGISWIPSGEMAKQLSVVEHVWSEMLAAKMDRHGLLISLGGGSTSDLAGFVASTYKRGIDVAHIPTTVISMVDAALGGKTGINFGGAKNQIGTFHSPIAVGVDSIWLETLPQVHKASGWMEMFKHALINGPESASQAFRVLEAEDFETTIAASARIKERIVEMDYFETGMRKALNFGHTVGHAIEAQCIARDVDMPHGIAVGYGMAFALHASVELRAGLTSSQASQALSALKHWLALYPLPEISAAELWRWMLLDKKNLGEVVLEVWLADWGKPIWDQALDFTDFQGLWLKTTADFAR